MSVKILFAPKQPPAVLDLARALVPPGYELVVADVGTPEFIEAAADAGRLAGSSAPSKYTKTGDTAPNPSSVDSPSRSDA